MAEDNPYQSPRAVNGEYADVSAVAEDPASAAKRARIARNIRAICLLYVVFGSIAVLAGIGLLVDDSPLQASPVFGWGLLVGGCAGIISAMGVLRKRSWGILVCQIVSALYLLSFPVGTILGGYFLLNIGKVRSDFSKPGVSPDVLE